MSDRPLMNESTAPLPPELQSLAAKLSSLVPRGPELSREQLLFDCGRAAALAEVQVRPAAAPRNWNWVWPLTTVALAMLCVVLAIDRQKLVSVVQSPANEVPSTAVVPETFDVETLAEKLPAANSYAQLRATVLASDDWELPRAELSPLLPREELPTVRGWKLGG